MLSDELLRKAESGNIEAALNVANSYYFGIDIKQDGDKAFAWYNRVLKIDPENDIALTNIGSCYRNGFGVKKDLNKAIEYYENAINYENKEALGFLADLLFNGEGIEQNYERAIKLYIRAANLGNVEAQYMVYRAYEEGKGVDKDSQTALVWLRKAADNGHTGSQYLAGLYELCADNSVSAIRYFEKASNSGFLMAMYELAKLYLNGNSSIEKNKAIDLLIKSANSGLARSQAFLGYCYAVGEGVEKNDYEAVRWNTMAAEQGDSNAQKNLGISYYNGIGVEVNKNLAAKWFEKAASQGNLQAKLCLAYMYVDGDNIPKNYDKAKILFQEVIDFGESDCLVSAITHLADLYSRMNEKEKTFLLWKQAAERGDVIAKYNLGLCYYEASGTTKDYNQALYWWRQCAAEGNVDAINNVRILEKKLGCNKGSYQTNIPPKPGGCYVATAVYGSYDCPEVWTLRRYRDYTLALSWHGRIFIKMYYAISPIIVKYFGHMKWFKHMWRGTLDRMVKRLQSEGIESTPYKDKKF